MNLNDLLNEEVEINRYVLGSAEKYLTKWEVQKYHKNDQICEFGVVYEYFYIIIDGYANIQHTSEKGKTYSQSIYGPGTYFGELEIFGGKPYVCSIDAMSDVTLIRLERSVFLKWIGEDNGFLFYLMKTLCESSYELSLKASQDTLYSLTFRICDYLIECKENDNSNEHSDVFLSKKYLSEKFVVTKRSINRILKELQDQNLIRIKESHIEVLDLKGLIALREQTRYL